MTIPAEDWNAWRDTDMVRFFTSNVQGLLNRQATERTVAPDSMDLTFFRSAYKDGYVDVMRKILDILVDEFPPNYTGEE